MIHQLNIISGPLPFCWVVRSSEIENYFSREKNSALSLSEQLFLALHSAYKDPSRSSKLKNDIERDLKQFFDGTSDKE